MSSHGLFSMLAHSWCLFPFLKEHQSYWVIAPPLWPHLTRITSLKALSPNSVTLGVRASTCDFAGGGWVEYNSVHNTPSSFIPWYLIPCGSYSWDPHSFLSSGLATDFYLCNLSLLRALPTYSGPDFRSFISVFVINLLGQFLTTSSCRTLL